MKGIFKVVLLLSLCVIFGLTSCDNKRDPVTGAPSGGNGGGYEETPEIPNPPAPPAPPTLEETINTSDDLSALGEEYSIVAVRFGGAVHMNGASFGVANGDYTNVEIGISKNSAPNDIAYRSISSSIWDMTENTYISRQNASSFIIKNFYTNDVGTENCIVTITNFKGLSKTLTFTLNPTESRPLTEAEEIAQATTLPSPKYSFVIEMLLGRGGSSELQLVGQHHNYYHKLSEGNGALYSFTSLNNGNPVLLEIVVFRCYIRNNITRERFSISDEINFFCYPVPWNLTLTQNYNGDPSAARLEMSNIPKGTYTDIYIRVGQSGSSDYKYKGLLVEDEYYTDDHYYQLTIRTNS